ncbi:MAG: BLUF domain-containing protein [Planctomycetota bacterium]
MAELLQIAYVSRRLSGLTDHDIIDEIVLPSMRRNRAKGIGGCLLFNSDIFCQVLEGPWDAVKGLAERIYCDPRHTEITQKLRRAVEAPAFAKFHMRVLREGDMHRLLKDHTRREDEHDPAHDPTGGPAIENARRILADTYDGPALVNGVLAAIERCNEIRPH